MDYIEQQAASADGESVVNNVHADAEYENGIGRIFKNKLARKIKNKIPIGRANRNQRRADGEANAMDSEYENGFGKWLSKKIVRRRADGLENEINADGEPTIKPNKFLAIGVWSVIAIGIGLFALHAYQTLKTIKSK